MLTNDGETRLAQEQQLAIADDVADMAQTRHDIDSEDREYLAIKNRRTIAMLLKQRGLPIPESLTFVVD